MGPEQLNSAKIGSLANSEANLTSAQRDAIRRRVQRGLHDLETGQFEEYDAAGLRDFARLVARSARKRTIADTE